MSRLNLQRALTFAAAALLLGIPARAYYHYVYYFGPGPSFAPVLMNAKFDLTQLPNSTVSFYVTDSGPSNLAPNDSFGSVLGEVKQALAAWNAVPTSALRIAFGGLAASNQNSNTPGGQVVFQDLPPGVLGLGTPNLLTNATLASNAGGRFVPITKSIVILTNNTNSNAPSGPGQSYLEAYFTTAVHEIGHALGLQHTWTGSAMSQAVVRDTSRARPLDADDIASISELYGTANWMSNYGSISGTVRYSNGTPVTLASVVAISPTGPAVSALTNPDGSYTINGLPPNDYLVYVHPLPPDAVGKGGEGLQLPQGTFGTTYAPGNSFRSVFYPATTDPNGARSFHVTAGSRNGASPSDNVPTVDFSVQTRTGVPAYDFITYSYLDPGARDYNEGTTSGYISQTTAFVNSTQPQVLVYAVSNSGATAQTQNVSMLGVANAIVLTNSSPGMFLYFNNPGPATGPRHLVFNYGNDMYVLPNGVNLVQQGPPYINSVTPNGDGTVTLAGSNFGPDSRVFFDGLPVVSSTYNVGQNSITVMPPAGPGGQTSTVTVFNSDGQNSMFLQQGNPQTYTYPSSPSPQIQTVSPPSLPSGTPGVPYNAMVDITGANTHFVDGYVTVGFGTNDVTVSRVWVLGPTHLVANVVVAPGAAVGTSEISVISGFNVMTSPSPFQIQPANPSLPVIGTVINAQTNQQTLYPNSFAVVYGLNLGTTLGSVQATLNGTSIPAPFSNATQVNLQIPAGFPVGPAVLAINTPLGPINAVVQVGNPPVTILGTGFAPAGSSGLVGPVFFNPGDTVTLAVSGLDPSVVSSPSRLQVTVSGVPMAVTQIAPANGQFQIQFSLTQSFGGAQVPVVVTVDGSASAAFTIGVR